MGFRYFIIVFFFFVPRLGFTQAIQLNEDEQYEIRGYASHLEDPTGALTFDDIIRSNAFTSTKSLNFGFDDAVHWFSFEVQNNSEREEWLLEIGFSPLDEIDFFYEDESGWKKKTSGDNFPISVRDVRHQHPLFKFKLAEGQKEKFYLRIRSTSSVQIPAIIWNTDAFYKQWFNVQMFNGMFYGALFIMIFYQFFLFLSTRDRISLYYVFTLIAMLHVVSYFQGYSFLYAYPELPQLNHFMAILTGPIFLVFSTSLTRAFLNLRRINIWLDRLLLFNMGFDLLAAVAMIFFFGTVSYRFHHYAILIHSILALLAAAYSIYKKFLPALYYLLSWLTLLVATFVFSLSNLGFLPEYLNTNSSWLIVACILQMLFISFALGNRWNMMNRENQQSREIELKREQREKERLEHEVKVRTEEIQIQNRKLEEVNRIKDKLFSIVSHDIKGPLTSLQLALGLLKNSAISQEEFHELANILDNRFHQTTEFIENLLHWASLQLKGSIFEPAAVDMKEVTDNTLRLLDYEIKNKSIHIHNLIKPESMVFADPNMVRSILKNISVNAIKFTRKEGTVTYDAVADHTFLTISVADTGIGIPASNRHRLFSLDSVTTLGTKQEKGTGLGLLLCKELVEKNNGKIWFESEEGKGTTFYFTLPLLKEK